MFSSAEITSGSWWNIYWSSITFLTNFTTWWLAFYVFLVWVYRPTQGYDQSLFQIFNFRVEPRKKKYKIFYLSAVKIPFSTGLRDWHVLTLLALRIWMKSGHWTTLVVIISRKTDGWLACFSSETFQMFSVWNQPEYLFLIFASIKTGATSVHVSTVNIWVA